METSAIQNLIDQQAIRDVLSMYCERLDRHELEAVAELFTPDCVTDYGPGRGGRIVGSDLLLKRFQSSPKGYRHTHHQLGQIRVEVKGDQATSIAYVIADHTLHDGARETVRMQYQDRLIRTASGWRIAHRRTEATVVDGDSTQRAMLPRNDARGR